MARFLYQARDSQGETASGVVAAANVEEAGRMLRAEGKFIVKISPAVEVAPADPEGALKQHARHVRREDVVFFAHQMAVMIETGVPISGALECLSDQAANPHFRAVIQEVARHVQGGGELSVALRKFPRVFPGVMVSLVRASEASGTMAPMLEQVSRYMAKEHRTLKQARGAMIYPAFMICIAVGVTIFLLSFVLPRFAAIYESRQAALPGPTRLLMAISGTLVNDWYLWLISAALTVGGLVAFARCRTGRRTIDWLKLNAPVLRHLFTHLYVTRSCRTMGTLITAGVPMLDTIAIVREVVNNVYYQELWSQVDEALRQGLQLSDPLFKSPLIPRSISQMIRSGEKSGRLGAILARIAEHTEQEFDDAVKRTTQFIEPLMIMGMGLLVGFIAIALLLPIFNISTVMAK